MTEKEAAFLKYWEENRFKEKSVLKQFFPGLPIGLALGAGIFGQIWLLFQKAALL